VRRRAIAALAVLVVLLTACGSDNIVKDGALSKDDGVPTIPLPTTSTTLPSAAGKPCKAVKDLPKGTLPGKPTTILMPTGVPPKTLGKSDLKVGVGDAVKAGQSVTVNYVGVACSTGKQFDSSWDSGTPFTTTLEEGGLIKGWVEGIPGMKKGGVRELVIPPALAYADAGNGDIAPGETLVFVIQLNSFKDAETPTTVETPTTAAETTTTKG